jgi:hypothetical protein
LLLQKIKQALYWLGTTLIVIAPALYNRYPLVYFDSGAYLEMSINLESSFHRTLGYPMLLKLTGWGISNWPIILFQGFLVSFVLFQLIKIFQKKNIRQVHFIAVTVLSFCTGLSWYAAQLMPDIFTLILILSIAVLFFKTQLKMIEAIGLLALIYISILTHLSHLPLMFLCCVAWFGLSFFKLSGIEKKSNMFWLKAAAPMVLAFITFSGINAAQGHGFKMSLSSNVFITANLGEMGILKMYLEENCGEKDLPFCDDIEHLPIETGGFLWDQDSYMTNHESGWAKANEECAPIVHDFLTKPRYLNWFVFSAVKATFKQLFQVDLGSGLHYQYAEGSSPYWPMKSHFKQELNEYLGSIQNKKDELPLSFFKRLNQVTLAISILIIGLLVLRKELSSKLLLLLLFFVIAYFFHAAITGVLANVYDRLQGRVVPLIQLFALLALAEYRFSRKGKVEA